MRRMVLALGAVILATPAAAGTARQRLMVDPGWLAKHLSDANLVILQVGDKAGYEAGHIPGSQLVSLADFAAPSTGPEALILEMPSPAALRARLIALGVTRRSQIVVVPTREGIQSATRVVFTLDAAGLGKRTKLLDGGRGGWLGAGRQVSTEAPKIARGDLPPLTFRPLVVDAAYVRNHLNAPGYVVVDARAPDFYSGARPGGMPAHPHRPGHIAGAKSVPFTSVTTPEMTLASPEEIAARFKAAGVKRGDTVVAYCHVGQQATATLFAARTLGIKALLYDGSFEEWSRLGGAVEPSK
jgi:thiosulfate/3-mercaptopyruvate sulfurtransferase